MRNQNDFCHMVAGDVLKQWFDFIVILVGQFSREAHAEDVIIPDGAGELHGRGFHWMLRCLRWYRCRSVAARGRLCLTHWYI